MEIIPPGDVDAYFHGLMTSLVVPRPIALVSTINKDGICNLAPFSFFNIFSSNPPVCVFSPSRRVRDMSIKHTLINIKENGEMVVNIVTSEILERVWLASAEYPENVNEFKKSGLTPVPSKFVKPPRVGESPINMECRLLKTVELGEKGGAGNLVIARILLIHVKDEILNEKKVVNPNLLKPVARLGESWYAVVFGDALGWLPQPALNLGIGYDNLPHFIKNSTLLTEREKYLLASFTQLPPPSKIIEFQKKVNERIFNSLQELCLQIKKHLQSGEIEYAWMLIILNMEKELAGQV